MRARACSAGSTACSSAAAAAIRARVKAFAEAHRAADADLRRAADRARLGASSGCPAASCRSTTRASSPPTCRRRPDSSYARTEAAVEQVEKYLRERAGVEDVTFLTGFSFLGQGMNTAQAFITLKDWSERGAEGFRRRDRRRHQPRSVVDPRRQDFGAAAAADRQSRQFLGLLVPPAGPRPEGLSGAGRRRRPADRGSQCQPGAAEGLCRGPAAGAAGQSDDRPRKGRRVRRHLRGHQPDHLDQSRLELHQRLPEPRAGCSA